MVSLAVLTVVLTFVMEKLLFPSGKEGLFVIPAKQL
jgi:hypothetical protein